MNYLKESEQAADAVQAEIFTKYKAKVAAVDPDAIADDGTIIGRNALTGELEPDATRTTAWASTIPMVQGFAVPVPEEPELAPDNEQPTTTANPWPFIRPGGAPPPLPAWTQPTGAHDAYILNAWVTHNGYDYCSLLAANVWEPTPESNYWRISPDPGPLPWKAPSGAMDAYDIGDQVTHTVDGRDTDLWESNITANTTEPGDDGTYDRWWKPITDAGGDLLPWVQPMPGTAAVPYEIESKVTHDGKTWQSNTQLNVWEPGVYGWDEIMQP